MKICKKCILPENFKEVTINDDGICSYCQTNTTVAKEVNVTKEQKEAYRKEIDKIIDANKGKGQYDCVVGYSGGKDSAYLIWKLKNEYQLNVLAVVVDHGYMPDTTLSNLESVPQKMGVDTIRYNLNSGYMERFFKFKFENYRTKAVFDDMCADCSNILEGMVIKVAALFGISLVFIGLSPEQVNRYFYEVPREHLKQDWVLDIFKKSTYFKSGDEHYSWQGENMKNDAIKVLLPFHVWDYDEENIVCTLEEQGLLSAKSSNPLMTRCKILDTMCYLDQNRIGYDGFIAPFSDLIRLNKAPRKKYYDMFFGDQYEINMNHVEEVIKRLELDMNSLISK
jgi:Predicted ATPase of the PP-loop superfamily implicated in cell cycle control